MELIILYFFYRFFLVYIYLNSFIDDNRVIGSRDSVWECLPLRFLSLRKGKPLNMCTELILFDLQKFCQLGGESVTKRTLADEETKAWRGWEEMGPPLHYLVRWTKQDL